MTWLSRLPVIRHWIGDQDLDDELRFHLEMEAQKLVEKGLNPQEAQRQARLAFGGYQATMEECRDVRPLHLVGDFGRDLREATRALGRSPCSPRPPLPASPSESAPAR